MDMAEDREARLGGLEGILSEVDRLHQAGDLELLTMGALAARYLGEP